MADRPTRHIAVILARMPAESRWEDHQWTLHGAVPDVGGEPRVIFDDGRMLQRLHPGLEVVLYPDEAEGYYLNASSQVPSIFVSIRRPDEGGDPYPFLATLSYNEAARWMDGGEKVDRTVAWPELAAWMGQWVEDNYRPEPKRRERPKSFVGKEGVLREKGAR
jgi:hypothetical protein